jgi:malate/lactate dehydrogenase
MGRPKITVVGAGNVGATCAHWAAAQELAAELLAVASSPLSRPMS